jgi:hypothetical protein
VAKTNIFENNSFVNRKPSGRVGGIDGGFAEVQYYNSLNRYKC